MDDKKYEIKKRIKGFFIFFFVWLFFAGLGLFFAGPNILDRNDCTDKETGIVIKVETDYNYNSNNSMRNTMHFPTIEYNYKGKTYTSRINFSSSLSSDNLREGDIVNIYVDPNDPEHISLEMAEKDITVGLIIIYVCAALEVFNFILLIIDLIKISKGKEPILVTL